MNKTKIDWCDMSWNPVTGCLHGCSYCYARKIATRFSNWGFGTNGIKIPDLLHELDKPYDKQGKIEPYPFKFEPTFHRYRLDEPKAKTKPRNIFVCSMADLFGAWVPDEWIREVFAACEAAPQHRYIFLTKNYIKASNFKYRDNWWIGKTITNDENSRLCEGDPWSVDGIHRAHQFLSIEPLQGDINDLKYYLHSFQWIIIGAETGNSKEKVIPQRSWIENIVNQCQAAGVPVFMKSSLTGIWGTPLIQEFPWEA